MTVALAFDIYGTLINPHGVVDELARHVGERAQEFSNIWREKQLEYTFRRGLMGRYENFPTCTRQALDYSDSLLQTGLDESAKDALMQVYRKLPAYDDVPASLQALADAGFRMFGFSNGVADAVSGLLQHAGIDQYFEGVVSVDTIGTFKPDPRVYRHFIDVAATDADHPSGLSALHRSRRYRRGSLLAGIEQCLRRYRRGLGGNEGRLVAAFEQYSVRSLGDRTDSRHSSAR